MGEATSAEEIARQHVAATEKLHNLSLFEPPVIGEIHLRYKQAPVHTLTFPDDSSSSPTPAAAPVGASPEPGSPISVSDVPRDSFPCVSTRGIADVSSLRLLISDGFNSADSSPSPALSGDVAAAGPASSATPPPPPLPAGGGDARGQTMWDDAFAARHNVRVVRPSHDAWGIKKIVLLFCDDFMQTVYEMPFWHSPTAHSSVTVPASDPSSPAEIVTFKSSVMPILKELGLDSPSAQRRIVRMLLASIPPGVTIPVHHDTGEWVSKTHRVHCPVITDVSKVLFLSGTSAETMRRVKADEGRIFELNNQAKHAVSNTWDEYRVHLILDYVEEGYEGVIKRRVQLSAGEELVQTRRSIDRRCEFGTTKCPSFVVIGAQKAGTTSMYEYLNQHPLVVRSKRRETHFFDWRWQSNLTTPAAQLDFYSKFFLADELKKHPSCMTGESTPSYLLHSDIVIPRLKAVCPWVKLIVMLRDPTKRAMSHYAMITSDEGTEEQKATRGAAWKGMSFEQVIDSEMEDLKKAGLLPPTAVEEDDEWYGSERERAAFDRYLATRPMGAGSHSMLARGLYELQLRPWLENFDRSSILVEKLEDMKGEIGARSMMSRAFSHVGLPDFQLSDLEPKNSREYTPMNSETKAKLDAFYAPYNRRLFKLMGWESWAGVSPAAGKGGVSSTVHKFAASSTVEGGMSGAWG